MVRPSQHNTCSSGEARGQAIVVIETPSPDKLIRPMKWTSFLPVLLAQHHTINFPQPATSPHGLDKVTLRSCLIHCISAPTFDRPLYFLAGRLPHPKPIQEGALKGRPGRLGAIQPFTGAFLSLVRAMTFVIVASR